MSSVVAVCPGSDFADSLYKAGQKPNGPETCLTPTCCTPGPPHSIRRMSPTRPRRPRFAWWRRGRCGRILGPDPAASDSRRRFADTISARDILDARERFLPPPQLAPSNERKTFNLKGDARAIFDQVAAAYGFQVVFEADYQSPPPFSFRMDDADGGRRAARAGNGFEFVSGRRESKLALVVRDTPAKRTERMPAMAVEIPISERMTAQDAQELMTAVQQTLDIRRAVLDPAKHVSVCAGPGRQGGCGATTLWPAFRRCARKWPSKSNFCRSAKLPRSPTG